MRSVVIHHQNHIFHRPDGMLMPRCRQVAAVALFGRVGKAVPRRYVHSPLRRRLGRRCLANRSHGLLVAHRLGASCFMVVVVGYDSRRPLHAFGDPCREADTTVVEADILSHRRPPLAHRERVVIRTMTRDEDHGRSRNETARPHPQHQVSAAGDRPVATQSDASQERCTCGVCRLSEALESGAPDAERATRSAA